MKFRIVTTDNACAVPELALKVTTASPLVEEAICYQCHNNPANSEHGVNVQAQFTTGTATWTGQPNKDYYTRVNTRHDISNADQTWSGTKIECTNCHSGHAADRTYPLKGPDTHGSAWTGDSIGFCLKCHDNTWASDGTVKPPAAIRNIAVDYQTDQHGYAEGSRNTTYFQGYYQGYPAMQCTDCHDAHGGGGLYHLKTLTDQYGRAITITDPNSHEVTHWCSHCHDNPMNQIDSSKDGCASRSCHLHGTSSF